MTLKGCLPAPVGLSWSIGVRRTLYLLLGAAAVCVHLARADVLINEFVADNETGLRTAAGQYSDWIELVNTSPDPANISGWYLTDRAATPTKWRVPDGTIIPGHGYLVIFADNSTVSITNNELHANFALSNDGEYLGLIQPDGITVAHEFAPAFPPQFRDTSYGLGLPAERGLVGSGTTGRYRIPNSGGTAPWFNGTGAFGFSSTNGSFTVRYYEMNRSIDNIDMADAMVAHSSYWKTDRTYPIVGQFNTIDFHGTGSSGNFSTDRPFPGHTAVGEDRNTFVLVVESSIYVPAAGLWTFGVGSDDGFRLQISGHGVEFTSEFTTLRGFDTTLATFNFPVAGFYDLHLIYNENFGGATFEFCVAQGFQEAFSNLFRLVGDPAGAIRLAGPIGTFIDTDVGAAMRNINARIDAEWTFSLAEPPPAGDIFTLYLRCADGFSASLNGTPMVALNAPAPLLYNSSATAKRPLNQAVQWLAFPVTASLLSVGVNTLAITGLNDSAADPDFLIAPRLATRGSQTFPAYFKTPTPGAANAEAYTAPTPGITASEARGYRTSPFTVTLACPDNPAAGIRYTLDGRVPTTNSPVYGAPLSVTKTTTLRAAVVDPGAIRQNVTTVTWLFLEDILQQGPTPPPGWPASRAVNNHVMEYGVRQEIVTADPVRLRNGMTNSIPSISIVTDLDHLFNAQRGIYVNPANDGIAWERPVSVELIDPVRGSASEFHIDAGLRIRGAFSRSVNNPKHAFRLFFRSVYGEGKLRFRLFDDEGAAEFDKVDLRTSSNYSWAYENSDQETFVRETFSRDSQRDMGKPYTRSRYYHLYLNGQYWGLYQTQERGDADYAATYFGGPEEDWDCIKTSQPGYVTTASDGTFDAFNALHNIAINQGFTGAFANNYFQVRGLNPDGTPNPAYPAYLDEDNLIVYMLIAYYTGDPDSPVSHWGGFANNMYGLYNRLAPAGFKWLRHDAEHSLGSNPGYGVDTDTTLVGSTFTEQGKFNPATLHQRLCEHPAYRLRFADLVQKYLYGDGALTPANAQARFRSRMQEIDLAIIGESARWGRGKTRDAHWLPACNWVVDTYLAQRREIIIGHFRTRGWFPSLDAPGYSVMNTVVPSNQVVRIIGTSTFYYTTNGSDPRLVTGAINPAAIAVPATNGPTLPRTVIPRGATWRFFDSGTEPPASGLLTWKDPGYPDSGWSQGPAILGFVGSATVNPVATPTRRYVNGVSLPQVTTTYFRHTFNLDSTTTVLDLVAEILRDDGTIVYLNGTEITAFRENMPAGATYDTYASSIVSSPDQNTYFSRTAAAAHLLRLGANTLAVELHQCNDTSSDLYFDLSLTIPGSTVNLFTDLTITRDMVINARAFNGSEWSALSQNTLTVEKPPVDYSALRVSELMYAPPSPPVGSPYVNDDFAWIELRNHGSVPLDLKDVRFDTGITHAFTPFLLAPGARLVLAKNPAAFATVYPTNNLNLAAWTSGNLARGGELLTILDPPGSNILAFTYSRFWYPETFNTGYSLVAVDPAAPEPAWSTAANWRPGRVPFGTPGFAEPASFLNTRITAEGLLLAEVPGLEGEVALWLSEDLAGWTACDPGAWSREGSLFTINLNHSSIVAKPKCFFQLRNSN